MMKTKKMYNMLVPNNHFKNGIFSIDLLKNIEYNQEEISKTLDNHKKQVLLVYVKNVEQYHNSKIYNNSTHILLPENTIEENQFPTSLFKSILNDPDLAIDEQHERIINVANIMIKGSFQMGLSNLNDLTKYDFLKNVFLDIANPIPENKQINN